MVNLLTKYKYLILLFFFTLFLRTILINQFPIGITHDELNYILAGRSISATGHFVPGTAPALIPSLMKNYDVVIAEVPAYILALLNYFSLNSRGAGALFNSLTVILIYLLSFHFLKEKKLAYLSGVFYAINPWSFLMGRTVFETNFYIFFFLFGLIILLKTTGKKIFFALLPFLLGFLSYTGGQISFYLFMVSCLILRYRQDKKNPRNYYLFFLIISIIFAFYLIRVTTDQSFNSRGGEMYLPNNPEITKEVDAERLVSIQTPLSRLFVNKFTVYSKGLLVRYLHAFDVNILFLNGEVRAAYSLQQHGTFYFLDFLFIIVGAAYLYAKKKDVWFFFLTVILIAPLTSALSNIELSYSQRAALMYPYLIILAALGIYSLVFPITRYHPSGKVKQIYKSPFKGLPFKVISILVTTTYLILFTHMLYLYFFRFPVYASDGWFFQDRQLSKYINLTKEISPDRQIIVISNEPKIIFEEYLYYSNLYTNSNIKKINSDLDNKIYNIGNVTFKSTCPNITNATVITVPASNCLPPFSKNNLRITRFRDIYENYLIYNDPVCNKFALMPYVSPDAYTDFNIEKQSTGEFCRSWITKL